MAALLAGQSINSVAREYKIPRGTIGRWASEAGGLRDTVSAPKKAAIGEKLVDLVETEIESLRQISIVTRDPQWIKSQSAADLAVFAGVKHDKLMRMLEAFGDSDSDSQD